MAYTISGMRRLTSLRRATAIGAFTLAAVSGIAGIGDAASALDETDAVIAASASAHMATATTGIAEQASPLVVNESDSDETSGDQLVTTGGAAFSMSVAGLAIALLAGGAVLWVIEHRQSKRSE